MLFEGRLTESLCQFGFAIRERTSPLLEAVAIADGDRVVAEGLAVDGDAERRAYLILATVAATHGAFFIVKHIPPLLECAIERTRFFRHAVLFH